MKKHPLDVLSLVFGLVFLVIAGSWAAKRAIQIDLPKAGWLVAGGLIVVGVLGLVSALRGSAKPAEPAGAAPLESDDTRIEE